MSAILPINWADKKNSPLLADFIAKYGSEYCMTAEEINQLRDAVNEMAVIQQSTFLGTAEPTSIPAGTGRAYWIALKQGTYPNHGNVVVGANEIAFIVRDAAGIFSISKTTMPILKGDKGDAGPVSTVPGPQGPQGSSLKVPTFINGPYPVDSQVNSLGKDWVNTVSTVIDEIPGTSSKWVERLSYATSQGQFITGGLDNLPNIVRSENKIKFASCTFLFKEIKYSISAQDLIITNPYIFINLSNPASITFEQYINIPANLPIKTVFIGFVDSGVENQSFIGSEYLVDGYYMDVIKKSKITNRATVLYRNTYDYSMNIDFNLKKITFGAVDFITNIRKIVITNGAELDISDYIGVKNLFLYFNLKTNVFVKKDAPVHFREYIYIGYIPQYITSINFDIVGTYRINGVDSYKAMFPANGNIESNNTTNPVNGSAALNYVNKELSADYYITQGKYIDKTNGNLVTIADQTFAVTDLLEILKDRITFNARGSAGGTATLAYYDVNKIFISSVSGLIYDNITTTILKSNMPVGTVYVRSTGVFGQSFINFENYKTIRTYAENILNAIKYTSGSKFFANDNFFINATTGDLTSNTTANYTDYLKIDSKNGFNVFGLSGTNACLVAFYDTNKIFISSISGAEKSAIDYFVAKSAIPSNAVYVRCSGIKANYNYVTAPTLSSINEKINEINIDTWTKKGKYILGDVDITKTTPAQVGEPTALLTTANLYSKYDALMAQFPNYITKENCDDAMLADGVAKPAYLDGKNTFLYKFRPKYPANYIDGSFPQNYNELKIMIVTGTHPEFQGMYSLFNYMKFICQTWQTDGNANRLRYNVTFYILPTSNLSGNDLNKRTNFNDVDLNRNCPTKNWAVSSAGTVEYSGPSSSSEYETKLFVKYLKDLKPNIHIDIHNFGLDSTYGYVSYAQSSSQLGIDIVANSMSEITRKLKSIDTNLPQDADTMLGWLGLQIEGSRSLYAHEQGLLSFTYETCSASPYLNGVNNGQSNFKWSDSIHQTNCMQGLSIFLLNVLKNYCSSVKPNVFKTL